MLFGSIIGDIVGSKYEFDNIRKKEFPFFDDDMFFTDDTVMSIAVWEALANSKQHNYRNLGKETIKQLRRYAGKYPKCSYGSRFTMWIYSTSNKPYNSYGNGSAMRIGAVPYFASSIDEVKYLSKKVSEVTHNHIEGIKGAEATAVAIYLALQKKNKKEIKKYIEDNYYSLDYDYEDLRENYDFDETCQGTVPQAIYCFLISDSFEDAIRNGISLGGDSDTICAIIGSIAEAYYGIDNNMKEKALKYLDKFLQSKVVEANIINNEQSFKTKGVR